MSMGGLDARKRLALRSEPTTEHALVEVEPQGENDKFWGRWLNLNETVNIVHGSCQDLHLLLVVVGFWRLQHGGSRISLCRRDLQRLS